MRDVARRYAEGTEEAAQRIEIDREAALQRAEEKTRRARRFIDEHPGVVSGAQDLVDREDG